MNEMFKEQGPAAAFLINTETTMEATAMFAFKPKSVRQRSSVFFAQGIVKIRGFSIQLLKQ